MTGQEQTVQHGALLQTTTHIAAAVDASPSEDAAKVDLIRSMTRPTGRRSYLRRLERRQSVRLAKSATTAALSLSVSTCPSSGEVHYDCSARQSVVRSRRLIQALRSSLDALESAHELAEQESVPMAKTAEVGIQCDLRDKPVKRICNTREGIPGVVCPKLGTAVASLTALSVPPVVAAGNGTQCPVRDGPVVRRRDEFEVRQRTIRARKRRANAARIVRLALKTAPEETDVEQDITEATLAFASAPPVLPVSLCVSTLSGDVACDGVQGSPRDGPIAQACHATHSAPEEISLEQAITAATLAFASAPLVAATQFVTLLPKVDVRQYSVSVREVVAALQRAVSSVDGAVVHVFGSAANGFGDATSDVDMVLQASHVALEEGLGLGAVAKRDLVRKSLAKVSKLLWKHGFRVEEWILGARVPIIKLSFDHIQCDLSVNNLLPNFNTALLRAYAATDRRVVEVTHAVKRWAKGEEVHGAPCGHLSSYALTLMVIFYMQIRGALPCFQRGSAERPLMYTEGSRSYNVAMDFEAGQEYVRQVDLVSLGDFATFYSEVFSFGECVVSVRRGMLLGIREYPGLKTHPRNGIPETEAQGMIHIEDPFDVERNLNCVLSPGTNAKLWFALKVLARRHRKDGKRLEAAVAAL